MSRARRPGSREEASGECGIASEARWYGLCMQRHPSLSLIRRLIRSTAGGRYRSSRCHGGRRSHWLTGSSSPRFILPNRQAPAAGVGVISLCLGMHLRGVAEAGCHD